MQLIEILIKRQVAVTVQRISMYTPASLSSFGKHLKLHTYLSLAFSLIILSMTFTISN